VAGREKDLEFLIEMVRHRMLDEETVEQRIACLTPGTGDGVDLHQRWARILARVEDQSHMR
jgi:septin family protein